MAAITLPARVRAWRQPSVLPGFGLTLGFTLAYLGLIVLIPLGALFVQTAGVGWQALWTELTSARTLASHNPAVASTTIPASRPDIRASTAGRCRRTTCQAAARVAARSK